MRHALFWLSLILTVTTAQAATCPPKVQQAMQAAIERAFPDAGAPGVVALLDGPSAHCEWTRGVADLGTRRPLALQDRFRIASITKLFVAATLMRLVEQGKLSLDDPVTRWLPWMGPTLSQNGALRVRDLATHRSGLPQGDVLAGKISLPDLSKLVESGPDAVRSAMLRPLLSADVAPTAPAGTRAEYNNDNYLALGLVIEAATGRRLVEVMRSELLDPLKLSSATLEGEEAARGAPVTGYTDGPNGVPSPVSWGWVDQAIIWSAGGLTMNAADLARFTDTLMAGRVFRRPDTLRAMLEAVPGTPGYNIGILHYTPDLYGHDGGMSGFRSQAFFDRSTRTTLVFWTNTSGTGPAHDFDALRPVVLRDVLGALPKVSGLAPPDLTLPAR